MQLNKKQKYLRLGGLIGYIVLLNTVCPLSTDMYMPSLPTIAGEFGVSAAEINSTLYLYFLFLSIGIVIIGPISDKYGRKILLIISTALYAVTAFVCFLSADLFTMIVARSFMGLAGGGMLSVITAVIKDSFEGRSRAVILSISQALGTIAPIVAPLLGAAVVQVASWHYVFLVLTLIGLVMVLLSCLFQETIPSDEVVTENVFRSYMGLGSVFRNKSFVFLLLTVALFVSPFMAYLGNATYIYQEEFGCSTLQFSMFFAVTAAISIIGAVFPVVLSKNLTLKKVRVAVTCTLSLGLISTALIFFVGRSGAFSFFGSIVIYVSCMTFIRPFLTDVILAQHDGETGSAAAALNFIINVIGSIAMIIGSQQWNSHIIVLVATLISFILLSWIFWIFLNRSKVEIRV